jgi:hypothetical protein
MNSHRKDMIRAAITFVLAVAVVIAACAVPEGALAASKACPDGYRASHVRAYHLPAKTDGYAPPCLVAGGVHGTTTYRIENPPYRFPKFVRVMGARWSAGKWRVRHRQVCDARDDNGVCQATYEKMTARRVGHRHQRVEWRFVS